MQEFLCFFTLKPEVASFVIVWVDAAIIIIIIIIMHVFIS
jgi:hypothetical protein